MWHLLLALPHAYAGPRALNLVGLEALAPAFEAAGAETDADLALLTDADLAALGLNLVQRRKLQRHLELQRHQGVVEEASFARRDLAPGSVAGLRTFGSAGKAVTLAAGENELYNHTCSSSSGLCILGHMWFGGGLPQRTWPNYALQRLRVYVDGEAAPSIDAQLYLLHGIGFGDDTAPWSSGDLVGKTGSPSGTFNTLQIPFARTLRVTMQSYANQSTPSTASERFWWIFRGTEGETAVALGTRTLPASARLRLHRQDSVEVAPLGFLPLLETHSAGAVLMATLSVSAHAEQFLEGEVRLNTSGTARASCSYGICSSLTLSSGTEDYFLGTY